MYPEFNMTRRVAPNPLGASIVSVRPSPQPQELPIRHAAPQQAPAPTPTSVDPASYTKPYCEFMTENPTIFHAVTSFSSRLESAGFKKLSERDVWSDLEAGGKYYCTRNDSALIAFAIGEDYRPGNGFGIVAGHIDGK